MNRTLSLTVLVIALLVLSACSLQGPTVPAEPAETVEPTAGQNEQPPDEGQAATEEPANSILLPVVPVDRDTGVGEEPAVVEGEDGGTITLPVMPKEGQGDQPGEVMPVDPKPNVQVPLLNLGAQPGDQALMQGKVFLDSARLMIIPQEQIAVFLQGNLPSPCHQLRADVSPQDAQGQVQVEVYSVIASDKICAQVLQPFGVAIPIEASNPDQLDILVNGKEISRLSGR